MRLIDFQARIDNNPEYPFLVAMETARWSLTVINHDFRYIVSVFKLWDGIGACVESRATGECFASFEFDIAGCTIDAALLEQLHNEVTAWFTKIKSEASNG